MILKDYGYKSRINSYNGRRIGLISSLILS